MSRRLAGPDEIAAIVGFSRGRNATLDVTGALVAAPTWFSQILEGPSASVDALMVSICRDRRHTDVQVLVREEVKQRQFGAWALAYNGSSYFVDRLIEVVAKPTGAAPERYHVQRLIQCMTEFVQ